jgi:hypothetical protein
MNSRRLIFTLSLTAERSYKPHLATGRVGCSQLEAHQARLGSKAEKLALSRCFPVYRAKQASECDLGRSAWCPQADACPAANRASIHLRVGMGQQRPQQIEAECFSGLVYATCAAPLYCVRCSVRRARICSRIFVPEILIAERSSSSSISGIAFL